MPNSFHILSHTITPTSFDILVLFNKHHVQFILREENLRSSPTALKRLRQGCEFLSLERPYCEHGLNYASDSDSDPGLVPSDSHLITEHQAENFYQDFVMWVRRAAEPSLTASIPHHTLPDAPTLADFFFPEVIVCTLHAVNNQLVPLSIERQPSTPSASQATWSQHFPIIASRSVLVHADPDDDMPVTDLKFEPAFVSRASDPETMLFFKATPLGAETELAAYTAMRHANLHVASNVRISQLVAVVQDEGGGRVLGLIYEDVQSCATLDDIYIPNTDANWLNLWIKQVSETVAALHAAGITWGNASAENVSIDSQNNAWISNFGDDLNEDYDDLTKSEAIESDRYALRQLAEMMGTALPALQQV